MQTRRMRQASQDAKDIAGTEKPRKAAKKRQPLPHSAAAAEEEKPEQEAKRSTSRGRRQTKVQLLKRGRPGKKDSKDAQQSKASQAANGHESEMKEAEDKIKVNRAPVLTMWVGVVAAHEGYSYEEGLSFGKAIAGLLAQSKGRRLGLYEEPSEEKKEERKRKRKELDRFPVFGMNVPGKMTQEGLRFAVQSGKPISPASVVDYLQRSFGRNYERAKGAMEDLANSYPSDEIGKAAYSFYEKFRPTVPYGMKGWGAKGFLNVDMMRSLRNA